jgi:hypothetical protein
MSRPNLDAIRERCEAATPGPWEVNDGQIYTSHGKQVTPRFWNYRDAEFTAVARTVLPALLAYIAELEAEIDRMRDSLEFAKIAKNNAEQQTRKLLIEVSRLTKELEAAVASLIHTVHNCVHGKNCDKPYGGIARHDVCYTCPNWVWRGLEGQHERQDS